MSLEEDFTESFRSKLFERFLEVSCPGVSVKSARRIRDEDLAVLFRKKVVLDRVSDPGFLARRGSEFERRSGDVGGSFVNLLLMVVPCTVKLGVVGVGGWP